MTNKIKRREFIGQVSGAAVALGIGAAAAPAAAQEPAAAWTPKKAFLYDMLPGALSVEDRFKLVRDVGFDGVEAPPITDPAQAERMRTAAEKAGVRVHSVIYGGWDAPLTDPDPAVRARGMKAAEAAMQSAHNMGADDILLVPGIVTEKTRYVEAYQRSQKQIRELIPTAERLNILILIEEVWNKFLLSPLEYARYLDEFRSPWVHSYFDVGNVVDFAWPEDWIRTVGPRIRRVHLKDFKRGPRQFVNIGDGDVNWPEVRRAFMEVGYHGFMTTELSGGDEPYLRDLAARVDKVIAGA
ncbi:MAG TPA: sugar phosphate isomerase/epimerase family protein [Armatimonadota bacterium]|nr:sugar phosphate isomerase/epimerase family protein [Armatimonadota bacterium]